MSPASTPNHAHHTHPRCILFLHLIVTLVLTLKRVVNRGAIGITPSGSSSAFLLISPSIKGDLRGKERGCLARRGTDAVWVGRLGVPTNVILDFIPGAIFRFSGYQVPAIHLGPTLSPDRFHPFNFPFLLSFSPLLSIMVQIGNVAVDVLCDLEGDIVMPRCA